MISALGEEVFTLDEGVDVADQAVPFQAGHSGEHGDWILVGEIRPG